MTFMNAADHADKALASAKTDPALATEELAMAIAELSRSLNKAVLGLESKLDLMSKDLKDVPR